LAKLPVLAAFAHPDDETILSGGTLAMLIDRGAEVHLLLATRGEGGELGEPPLIEQSSLGNVRENEVRCAAQLLGIEHIFFLNYIDPLVGEGDKLFPFDADFESLSQEIGAAILATNAQVVLTHGSNGEYGHPAHQLMHRASLFGLQTVRGNANPLYSISASFPTHPRPRLANQDDPADFILDIEPWLDKKLEAAECHRTQGALFVRRSSKEAGRPLSLSQVLMRIESLHRAWPHPGKPIQDPMADFLRSHCADAILEDLLD
jgi:LmbE family N-acetylglucosaminyl deacetylase